MPAPPLTCQMRANIWIAWLHGLRGVRGPDALPGGEGPSCGRGGGGRLTNMYFNPDISQMKPTVVVCAFSDTTLVHKS